MPFLFYRFAVHRQDGTCPKRTRRSTRGSSLANPDVHSSLLKTKRHQRLSNGGTETRHRRLTHRTQPIHRRQHAIDWDHTVSSSSFCFKTRVKPSQHAVHVTLLVIGLPVSEPRWRSPRLAVRSNVMRLGHDIRTTLYRWLKRTRPDVPYTMMADISGRLSLRRKVDLLPDVSSLS